MPVKLQQHGHKIGRFRRQVVAISVIAVSLLCLWLMQRSAVKNRCVPQQAGSDGLMLVGSQEDVYRACAMRAVRGATIVQLGKFSNLQYWEPEHLGRSTPFPLRVFDVRPEYEKGLQPHNWLIIASRTGIVRKVVSVLPPEEFRSMTPNLDADFGLVRRPGGYFGFHYDVPRTVTVLNMLPAVSESVIVVVDASYFGPGSDPAETVRMLAERVPDVALLIAVSSLNEPEVTWEMRRKLALFLRSWQERR